MAKLNRKAIIHIILIGIILAVIFLITLSLKDQNNPDRVSAQKVVNDYLNYNTPLSSLVNLSSVNPSKLRIRIEKLKYVLTLFCDSKAIKCYPVVFRF